MKNVLIFILLLITTTALWYFSVIFIPDNINLTGIAIPVDNIHVISNSLFLSLALAASSFAIIILSLKVKEYRTDVSKSLNSNNLHLEIIALSALINECDTTLLRYDRWEDAGIKGDYMNAKSSVRDKMNMYRQTLENRYEDIQRLTTELEIKDTEQRKNKNF